MTAAPVGVEGAAGGVTVAVEAAVGSVVDIGVLVLELLLESLLPPPTFEVTADAAPVTFSLMTGAASLAASAACCAVCWTLGLLRTRVAAWRSCS
jgi:hypothetical protein